LIVNDQTPLIVDIARRAEDRNIECLFQGEHSHTPVATIYPASPDGELPEFYKRFPDIFVTLAAAAAVTSRIRLGTGIVLVAEHNPLQLAKAVASLDRLSNGRVEFGVGYGWNSLELANNGVPWEVRRSVFAEKLDVLKRLWTQEVVGFDGTYVSFTESWLWPKPVQNPYPPILLGANGRIRNLKIVVDSADGWYPMHSPDVPGQIESLRRLADDAGRPAPRVTVNFMAGQMPGTPWYWESSVANAALWRAAEEYRRLNVHRMVIGVPMDSLDNLTRGLDALSELVPRVA
jgi:probable F420-dependent oxidoreductase